MALLCIILLVRTSDSGAVLLYICALSLDERRSSCREKNHKIKIPAGLAVQDDSTEAGELKEQHR